MIGCLGLQFMSSTTTGVAESPHPCKTLCKHRLSIALPTCNSIKYYKALVLQSEGLQATILPSDLPATTNLRPLADPDQRAVTSCGTCEPAANLSFNSEHACTNRVGPETLTVQFWIGSKKSKTVFVLLIFLCDQRLR